MKKLYVALLGAVLLSGCAGQPIQLPLRPVSEPPTGQERTVNLGDRMLMQAVGYRTDILSVDAMSPFGVNIPRGTFCRVPGTNKFVSFNSRAVGLKNAFGSVIDYTNLLTYKPADNEICASGTITLCYDSSDGRFEVLEDRLCSDPTSFQQVIEYNGRAGKVLNFTYREFSRDHMRSAYTTNFTMDLNNGNEITYKGARLRILDASNEKITYQVISNFNDATL